VDFVHRDLAIECLPADIPEHITVDVTELMLHDGIRVRDLKPDGKWTFVSDPDMLIVHVIAPKVEAEPEPAEVVAAAAPTAPAEPEVIKKGKIEDKDKEKEKEKEKE
jgi:large subunit ribosomal protein L25